MIRPLAAALLLNLGLVLPAAAADKTPSAYQMGNPCQTMDIPADALVVRLYSHGGQDPVQTDWQTAEGAHQAKAITVRAAGAINRPIFLALTSYDPVLWDIEPALAGKVIGAYVSSYHTARVRGLASTVPVLRSAYLINQATDASRQEDSWYDGCPLLPANYGEDSYEWTLDDELTQLYGRKIDLRLIKPPYVIRLPSP